MYKWLSQFLVHLTISENLMKGHIVNNEFSPVNEDKLFSEFVIQVEE